ncbi:MAG: tRNA dihydrouridine synthase DusB [Acidimicrobiia bacterium]
MTLRIGPIEVPTPVVLAPMAGITNAPFRTLCRRYGGGIYVSEMIGARGLVEGNQKTLQLAGFGPDEELRSIQLYGTEPWAMRAAAERLVGEGRVDHIDLNFGCPAPKVTRHGGGAALPFKRRLFADLVGATVEGAGAVPVTVKLRMGIDDDHLTFLDAGRAAADVGAAAVALHARTAEQLYSGRARWDAIARLKEAVPDIPVLGNGDIWVAADAVAMIERTGCDGVVVGRGCLGRPWLFGELDAALAGRRPSPPPDLGGVLDVMVDHARLLVDWFGPHIGIRSFRKHTGWYLKGFPIGSALRADLHQTDEVDELVARTAHLDRSMRYPDGVGEMRRGHTNGPRRVRLPHGWLDDPDATPHLEAAAAAVVSGG